MKGGGREVEGGGGAGGGREAERGGGKETYLDGIGGDDNAVASREIPWFNDPKVSLIAFLPRLVIAEESRKLSVKVELQKNKRR